MLAKTVYIVVDKDDAAFVFGEIEDAERCAGVARRRRSCGDRDDVAVYAAVRLPTRVEVKIEPPSASELALLEGEIAP